MIRLLLIVALTLPFHAPAQEPAGALGLPDLQRMSTFGFGDIPWLEHRSEVRARKLGAALVPWTRWVTPPRPGDRSLLVVEGDAGVRQGLVFDAALGLVRVEVFVPAAPDAVLPLLQEQLGVGVDARSEESPVPGLAVQHAWMPTLTVLSRVEGGSLVVVEAPRELRLAALTKLPYEPWDVEGVIPREVAQARMAIGIPLLAGSFVGALVLLPFATKQPAASLAIAGPLGAGIAVGTALTISGATKMRGSLPRSELEAWEAAGPGLQ